MAKAYSDHLKAKGMEIIFVSSDRDAGAFDEYFHEMPWLALPFADRERKAALSGKYGVQGIPTMLFVAGGKVVYTQVGALPAGPLKMMVDKFLETVSPAAA